MRSHAGVAQQMFTALAEKGINIQVISTSEIKISVLVAEEYTELAVRALHSAYGLGSVWVQLDLAREGTTDASLAEGFSRLRGAREWKVDGIGVADE